MKYLFLGSGITNCIIPILTLIENQPKSIVGCILFGADENKEIPYWFIDSVLDDNPAQTILDHVKNERILPDLDLSTGQKA